MGKTFTNRRISNLSKEYKVARKWAHLNNIEGDPQVLRRQFNRAVRHSEKQAIDDQEWGEE